MVWIKATESEFPSGKCLAVFLEPFFGNYSFEITTAYFDNPKDYKNGDGKGWLDYNSDREIKVSHFMELPEFPFKLTTNDMKHISEIIKTKSRFGIVPEELIIKKEKNSNLKHCPFCGNQPEITTIGSCIDISCCVNMSFQKSDFLTIEERKTWNNKTYTFSQKNEDKVLNLAISKWNSRF